MKAEGLNFIYNQNNIPSEFWKVFYEFNNSGVASLQTGFYLTEDNYRYRLENNSGYYGVDLIGFSNNIVPSISGGQNLYSGILFSETTGVFSNNYVSISNTKSLDAPNWTMMFVFEKANSQEGVLFSNYHEGQGTKSGFVIGVNSTNHLYLENYNENGPNLHEANLTLGTRNAISVSKIGNQVEFSYFDFNSKNVLSDSFFSPDNSFLPSDNWYIGSAINPPSYFSGKSFNGKIEVFTYMTGNIFPPQRQNLFSGLVISKAPSLYFDLLSENCSYSYAGLTGEISDITFDTIEKAIYCAQTGYLSSGIGSLTSNVSGRISSGSGIASGYITGNISLPSGYTITTTGFVSGFSGYREIGKGIRVFQNVIPSGVTNYFIPFPNSFSESPVLFTEIQDKSTLLDHQILNITTSGFTIGFSNNIPSSGYLLTTTAAIPQVSGDLKFFKTEIPTDSDSYYISFNFPPISDPKVFCQIENPFDERFSYNISKVSSTGFEINLSNKIESPGLVLHSFITDLNKEDSFRVQSTPLISGANYQFINYDTPFSSLPLIFGEITNSNNDSIITHQISGVNNSGFYAVFSNRIGTTGYKFNSLSWSGVQNGANYLYTNSKERIYLGQTTDFCKNIYNLSGYKNSLVLTQYDVPIIKNVYFTGITGSSQEYFSYVDIPVFNTINYQISLNTGQAANFNHQILYTSDGSNLIRTYHTLTYNSPNIQPDSFNIYKTCYQFFGYKYENFSYDNNYIYDFGMDGVHYLKEINAEDLSELYVFPKVHNKLNIDIDAIFDRNMNQFFLGNSYTPTVTNVYLNGIGLLGAGTSLLNPKNTKAAIAIDDSFNLKRRFDYYISGNYIVSNSLIIDGGDDLVFDIISGLNKRKFRTVPDSYSIISGEVFAKNFGSDGYSVYLNGIKLTSGFDYTLAGGDVKILNTDLIDISGLMFSLPEDSDKKNIYSGKFNYLETERFARGTSMLWANGLRQNLDDQYIEVSKVGLLTGQRVFTNNNTLIFNNETEFWQTP